MSRYKEPAVRLNLTIVQRKLLAGLRPALRPRLALDRTNPRKVPFTLDEVKDIAAQCQAAVTETRNGRERQSLRVIVTTARTALDKFGRDTIHRIPPARRLYQFKITLTGISPPIWRRIQVKDGSLDRLHEHIQTSMGWTNSHLHRFTIHAVTYGDPEFLLEGSEDDPEISDSGETRISDLVSEDGKQFRFEYEYDFGDCWQHEILFEGCLAAEKGGRYPLCVEGDRACPPEDIGGTYGYYDYLRTLSDPDHDDWEQMSEWRGPFRPEQFDAKAATDRMRRGLPDWGHQGRCSGWI